MREPSLLRAAMADQKGFPMDYYNIVIVDGHAELGGPYPAEEDRDQEAKEVWLRHPDRLIRLNIDDEGVPTIIQTDIRLLDPRAIILPRPRLKVFP